MPKYELMYIIGSSVSDDQIPTVTDGVLKLLDNLGASSVREEQMGKKKLAYTIKKTKNGFYDAVAFEMPGSKLQELNQKILTTEGIIRHLIVNIEDNLARMQKDQVIQDKMNRNRNEQKARAATKQPAASDSKISTPITEQALEEKIEKALSDDLSKI